jgi:hypothetical protein
VSVVRKTRFIYSSPSESGQKLIRGKSDFRNLQLKQCAGSNVIPVEAEQLPKQTTSILVYRLKVAKGRAQGDNLRRRPGAPQVLCDLQQHPRSKLTSCVANMSIECEEARLVACVMT